MTLVYGYWVSACSEPNDELPITLYEAGNVESRNTVQVGLAGRADCSTIAEHGAVVK